MGAIDPAAVVTRRFPPGALALACLLAAGCGHLPPLIRSGDALEPQEHVRLGSSYEAQGLKAEAVAQYEAAVRRDPDLAEGWLALGNVSFADGRLEDAEKSFRTALKSSPGHPGACNNLAMTLLARDRGLEEAEALAREALARPGSLRPYILDTLASIRLKQSRYVEALDLVDLAEEATPSGDRHVLAHLQTTRESIQAAAAGQAP